ncbi:MAG: heme exporter protein CcmB [Bacteroidia bacterium]|nr:heme exporter protein CcmB [Bacteroidia bacterium]
MRFWKEFRYLLLKEVWVERKQKFSTQSLILYAFSMTFIASIAFKGKIHLSTWNALFWLLELFLAINAVAKSFGNEPEGQSLLIYQVSSASAVIFSKLTYNFILLSILSFLTVLFFGLLSTFPVQEPLHFLFIVIIGSFSLASCLTMIAAIAAQARGKSVLIALLSFPILLPQILTLIRLSKRAIDGLELTSLQDYWFLLSIDGIVLVLSALLFPFLWRE